MINDISDKLKKFNWEFNYTNIKKVLIILDFNNLLKYDNVHFYFARQLFHYIHIFKNLNVTWIDRDKAVINTLFIGNLVPKEISSHLEKKSSWLKANFLEYDLILCSKFLEQELYNFIKEKYFSENHISYKAATYSILNKDELNSEKNIFEPVSCLLNNKERYKIPEDQLKEIKYFKENFTNIYLYEVRKKAEKNNIDLLKYIYKVNKTINWNDINKVLILYDFNVEFYIGDTYFWYSKFNYFLLNALKDKNITFNCRNLKQFNVFEQIARNSIPNVKLSNLQWEDIKFEEYDLILIHDFCSGKFLNYLNNYCKEYNNAAIYYFNLEDGYHIKNDYYKWNMFLLLEKNNKIEPAFDNLIEKIKGIEKIPYPKMELVITEKEREWADKWLQNKGVTETDNLVILIDKTSTEMKNLKIQEYVKLADWFITQNNAKILLFDEENGDKEYILTNELGEEKIKKVIFGTKLELRQVMCLFASRYINAIIGPCTGFMHLVDGIYINFIKTSIMTRENIPLLITYTGENSSFDPWFWWGETSIVNCIVTVKVDGEYQLINYKKLNCNLEELKKIICRVNDIDGELIINYIKENHTNNRCLMSSQKPSLLLN